jgi:hypothetical protein
MKKRETRLRLHRDTVRQLDRDITSVDLAKVGGGIQTSCIGPACCGKVDTVPE